MKIFLEKYLNLIVYYENIFKGLKYFYCNLYGFLLYYYLNLGVYKNIIMSRIYRNMRMNFFFNLILIRKKSYFIAKRRFKVNFYYIYIMDFLLKLFYYNFSKKLIFFFRFLKSYRVCFYGNLLIFGLKLIWIDFYSFIKGIDEVLLYRESFFFKCELPRIIFNLYLFFFDLEFEFLKKYLYLYMYTFLGFRLVLLKTRKFRYKFYIRII